MGMRMAVEVGDVFASIIKCAQACIILDSEQRESNPRAGKEIGGRSWMECQQFLTLEDAFQSSS